MLRQSQRTKIGRDRPYREQISFGSQETKVDRTQPSPILCMAEEEN